MAKLEGTSFSLPDREERDIVEETILEWHERRFLTFLIEEQGNICGFAQLHEDAGRPEIGYWIDRCHRNRGLAQFLVRAVLVFAFETLGLIEIHAKVLDRNEKSQHILKKSGFTRNSEEDPFRLSMAEVHASPIVEFIIKHPNKIWSLDMQRLQEILDEYSDLYDLVDIELDDDGAIRLEFNGRTSVNIETSSRSGYFHLYSSLGRIPDGAGAGWYRMLLEANLFGRDTGHAATACDPATGDIMLCSLVDMTNMTPERLDLMLQDFVASAEILVDRMREKKIEGDLPISDVEQAYMIRI